MAKPVLSNEALSLLQNAVGEEGAISIPLLLGSLAPIDRHVVQLLVAGYIRLRQADGSTKLPPDRLVYDVTPDGRAAVDALRPSVDAEGGVARPKWSVAE